MTKAKAKTKVKKLPVFDEIEDWDWDDWNARVMEEEASLKGETKVIEVGLTCADGCWYAEVINPDESEDDEDSLEYDYVLEVTVPAEKIVKRIKVELV